MLVLKQYQRDAIEAFGAFLRSAQRQAAQGESHAASMAFQSETAERTGEPVPYLDIGRKLSIPELRGLPYVCLRLPTGGGKTLVAAHAAGVAVKDLGVTHRGVILWLVPSEVIRSQTLRALRNPDHPYRIALEEGLGPVRVVDVDEALYLARAAYREAAVVIIATAQSFKATEKEGRRVYRQDGALTGHFEGLAPEALDAGFDRYPDSESVVPSLANVLRLYRPVVIVDEAHNQRQPLAFDTLARFKPAAILELTATPAGEPQPSNVLYSVSAAALKAEAMIKLPLTLTVASDWTAVVEMALARREALERDAGVEREATGDYLRPLLLIQAQPRRKDTETVTVDVVESHLRETLQLRPEWIAVHAYDRRELEGVDLMATDCPVRVIVTVDALREGWDAPFAYVLASLGQVATGTAVEQLVGRVLRMPYARPKQTPALNEAFVYALSTRFAETLTGLRDALVQNGFEAPEARALVRSEPAPGLFDQDVRVQLEPDVAEVVLAALPPGMRASVVYDHETKHLVVRDPAPDSLWVALERALPEVGRAALLAARGEDRPAATSPVERGEAFDVPVLAIRQGDLFARLTRSDLLGYPWALRDFDASLPGFRVPDSERHAARLDVTEGGRVQTERVEFLESHRRDMTLFAQEVAWDEDAMVRWLDRAIAVSDSSQEEKRAFLRRVVDWLVMEAALDLGALMHARRAVAAAVEVLIADHRTAAAQRGFQLLLDGTIGSLEVDPAIAFSFPRDAYAYPRLSIYDAGHRFARHYYPRIAGMNAEESAVAIKLDGLERVEVWVRNEERDRRGSFWLPTSSDAFYPDFVARLTGGQILGVEHKSSRDWDNPETREKRALGAAWEKRSAGRVAFAMTRDKDLSAIDDAIARLAG